LLTTLLVSLRTLEQTPALPNAAQQSVADIKGLGKHIFDEVHRTVGDYSYSLLGDLIVTANPNCRTVGFTASLPGDRRRVNDILGTLRFTHVEARDETSEEVRPYSQATNLDWMSFDLPPVLQQIRNHLSAATSRQVDLLIKAGLLPKTTKIGFKTLLDCRRRLPGNFSPVSAALFSAIRLHHALTILETQSLEGFKDFLDRLFERRRAVGLSSLKGDPDVVASHELARGALMLGIEHPKVTALPELLSRLKPGEKALVFAGYRHSVFMLARRLNEHGITAGYLVGKSLGGLSQDAQVESVEKLKSGTVSVMVATQVGEEGLDISECNMVVFYDNVPSGVRFIQRRGRTGRRAPGKVFIFVTRGTKDEAYYWMGIKRLKEANRLMASFAPPQQDKMALSSPVDADLLPGGKQNSPAGPSMLGDPGSRTPTPDL